MATQEGAQARTFRGEELTRNEKVTVGTSSGVISDTQGRKVLTLQNTSTGGQTISVRMGFGLAVAGEGIVLEVGQTITDAASEGYTPYQGTISAISDAAGGQLSIFER